KKQASKCALTHKTYKENLKIKSKNKVVFLNIRKRFKFNGTIQKLHNILFYIKTKTKNKKIHMPYRYFSVFFTNTLCRGHVKSSSELSATSERKL
ncbi:hypothetical protein REH76_06420, partial [Photobacterium damselae]